MGYQIAFWLCWTGAGIANAFVDWFGFESDDNEWTQKYSKPLVYAPRTFYYRLTGLPFKEKFFLSGTILCFLTDRFHFYQFLQTSFLIASCCAATFLPFHWTFPIQCIIFWGLTTHISQIMVRRHYTKK